jgi:hypothetical protein
MSKKTYAAPFVKTEKVEIGVFGCYGTTTGGGGFSLPGKPNSKRRKGSFFSWFSWLWSW